MKRLVIVLTIGLLLATAFVASADCVPATGTSGDDIITCAGTSSGLMRGRAGNDLITVTGTLTGTVTGGANDDTITVDGTMTGTVYGDDTVTDQNGSDTIIINGTVNGAVIGDTKISSTAQGDDVIIINGTITAYVIGDSISTHPTITGGNDTFILRDGAHGGPDNSLSLSGDSGHNSGYDILVFQFTVNSEVDDLALSALIAGADPDHDRITFRGQTFVWSRFDELVNDLIRNYVPIVVTLDAFQPLRDGRLNAADHAAPVAVYPVDYGSGQIGLHLYDSATGVLLLEVTPELIAATDGVSEHTLIAEGAGVVVYRLADGTFYVGAPMANGKQYIMTCDELSVTTACSSTEVE